MRRVGLGKVEHYKAISEDDMSTLYKSSVFETDTPVGLLRKVFFEVMFYLCRRGEENLRELTARDFTVVKGKDGLETVLKISS